MIGCLLFARSRGWAPATLGVALLTAVAAVSAAWLASRPFFQGPVARVPVTALTPVAAAALVGVCLGSWDVGLDRSTPHPWPIRRARQVVGWTAIACTALATAVAADPRVFGALAMLRNVIGYVGLACLGTVVLGAALSWLPGFLVASTLYLTAPRPPTGMDRLWAWPMTSGQPDLSWVAPVVLFAVGVTSYAVWGPGERTRGD